MVPPARSLPIYFAAVLAAGSLLHAGEIQYPIDASKSTVRFSIQHVFVERVTGSVPLQSGFVVLAGSSPVPIAVGAVLDAARIQTQDADQTNALRGPDFFDVKRFPTWTFTSTSITPTGRSSFAVDGLLTIHGVTQPEHLAVTIKASGTHAEYLATASIDRHAFGMKVVPLDPAIGNTADVTVDAIIGGK